MLKNSILYKLYDLMVHFKLSKKIDNSYAGEFLRLKKVIDIFGIKTGFVVDIAASDGVSQSCTLDFFKNNNWDGLAVEMDPKKFYKLSFAYEKFSNTRLFRYKVTPNNVTYILRAAEVPNDFTILNLDIDSYDYFIMKNILESGYKPIIITMEINEKIPPPIHFAVNYTDEHIWSGDHFYGCSLTAAVSLIKPYGYILESLEYNNAVFIRSDYSKDLFEDLDTLFAYNKGYKNKDDRKDLFPWNKDLEYILDTKPEETLLFINKYFEKYIDKFTLFKHD
jgi:hypothetical protein